VLRAGGSDRDWTGLRLSAPPEPPRVIIVSRRYESPARPRALSPAEIPWAVRAAVPWSTSKAAVPQGGGLGRIG